MRHTCATVAPPEDHEKALAEFSGMVSTMDEWAAKDPLAFRAPEFVALRAYSRVIQGAEAFARKIVSSPVPDEFETVSEEHNKLMSKVDTCLILDAKAFQAPEFDSLRKGSRVIECGSKNLKKITAKPVVDDFATMDKEYRDMMDIVNSCLEFDANALTSAEFMTLRKASFVHMMLLLRLIKVTTESVT